METKLIQTFLYSLKSERTKGEYIKYIQYFEHHYKHKIESLLTLHTKAVEDIIINYVISMREKGLSHSSISGRLTAISSFLLLNDFSVNTKKIKKFMGEQVKTVKDEAYTREDLQKMFEYATPRTRVIIAIFSSTGIRKSALLDLKLKHLTKIDSHNLYKFVKYENTKEEYITFCTPECASMIEEYIEQRKKAGEKITNPFAKSGLIGHNTDGHGRWLTKSGASSKLTSNTVGQDRTHRIRLIRLDTPN